MALIYKILPLSEWIQAQAKGLFEGSAIDIADGYIHFSTGAQALETARRYFADIHDLTVLVVEADDLGPNLKWEPSRGGDLFPHLYESLDCQRVREVRDAPLDSAGIPQLGDLA
jgi:uncharacterized protein (DUF952 family)